MDTLYYLPRKRKTLKSLVDFAKYVANQKIDKMCLES